MRFEVVIVRFWGRSGGPEEGVVVREHGEDNSEEEGRRCVQRNMQVSIFTLSSTPLRLRMQI